MSVEAVIVAPARAKRRRLPSPDREASLFTLALLPPAATAFLFLDGFGVQLATGLFVSLFWAVLFAVLRKRQIQFFAVPAAMLFALLLPTETPLWQAAIALSFGAVAADLIFGGRGYSFLHPAAAALAFLNLSWPAVEGGVLPAEVAIAALPGAGMLLVLGLLSLRTAIALTLALLLATPPAELLPILFLVSAFLVCDPGSGAATHGGRYCHGLCAGLLMLLPLSPEAPAAALPVAAFIASLLTPLFDVLARHARGFLEVLRHG